MTNNPRHRFVVEIDRDTHNRLKAMAIKRDTSVRAMVRRYIKAGLQAEGMVELMQDIRTEQENGDAR